MNDSKNQYEHYSLSTTSDLELKKKELLKKKMNINKSQTKSLFNYHLGNSIEFLTEPLK